MMLVIIFEQIFLLYFDAGGRSLLIGDRLENCWLATHVLMISVDQGWAIVLAWGPHCGHWSWLRAALFKKRIARAVLRIQELVDGRIDHS